MKSVVEIASIVLFAIVVRYGNFVHVDDIFEQTIRNIAGETYFIYLFHQQIGFVLMKWLINYGLNCNRTVMTTFIFVAIIGWFHYQITEKVKLIKRKKIA